MVSYRLNGSSLWPHSKRLSGANFMGFSRQLVFGDSNPFNDSFFGPPTTNVTSEAGAPGRAAEGLTSLLIGKFPILESTLPHPTGAR